MNITLPQTTKLKVQAQTPAPVKLPQARSIALIGLLSFLLFWNVVVSLSIGVTAYLGYSANQSPFMAFARPLPNDQLQPVEPRNPSHTDKNETPDKKSPTSENGTSKEEPRAKDSPGEKKGGDTPKPDDEKKDDTPKPEPADKSLRDAIRAIENGSEEEQAANAERLAKLGNKARSASRALCVAMARTSGQKRKVFLETLEKVNPDLYEPVVTLLVDEDARNHVAAANKVADLSDGKDTLPVLLKHIDNTLSLIEDGHGFHNNLIKADIVAMKKLAPGDPDVVKVFGRIIRWRSQFGIGLRHEHDLRFLVLDTLKDWSKSDPRVKTTAIELQREELKAFQEANPSSISSNDLQEVIMIMGNLVEYGADARNAISILKDLKVHSNALVRKKAAAALDTLAKVSE
jgi:hypothetical protein